MIPTLLWLNEAEVYRQALARAELADRLDIQLLRSDQQPSAAQLARTEILLARQVPPGVLAKMPRLRWIQALTVGVDNWVSRPDLRADIALSCARGTHRVQMPENILGALFHLTKPYAQATLDQRDCRWVRRVSVPLAGKTLGILGMGEIGRELAKKASALELRVIGTRRAAEPVPHVDRIYPPEATDEVLAQSDFVLLLLPLTPRTDRIMNAARFKAMRASAYLLNFGRGALIDDDDLVEAVRTKTIAGAVLDVYRTEPLPADHVFWVTEGITVLPHIGGLDVHRDEIVAAMFVDNMGRFLAGEPLAALVDRVRGY
ncbi:MAG: D-2-hydroxyacid dehydrogenase [Burkholderiales bacterium]|nr:D-2-hydroxyacid dehydrogenase [Burkholderiales bacterium]